MAESTWDIPYLNRKIFLFHYQRARKMATRGGHKCEWNTFIKFVQAYCPLAYFCDIFISGKKRIITWTDFSTFSEWITIFDFMSHVNFLAISIHYIYKTVLYDMQLLCKRLCNSKWCTQSRSFLRSPMKLSQSWDHPPIHLSGCAIHCIG